MPDGKSFDELIQTYVTEAHAIFQDDKLSVIQDCLSVAKDKHSILNEDYNNESAIKYDDDDDYRSDDENYQSIIEETFIDESNNYQPTIKQPVIENYDKRKQNQELAGLLMGVNNSFIPNVKNINGYLIYQKAKDF